MAFIALALCDPPAAAGRLIVYPKKSHFATQVVSFADWRPHLVFLKHHSVLCKNCHINPGLNPVSDAPSSVQHGQMQRGSVRRKEVTGEFPAFSAVLDHLYKTYLSPRGLGESPGDTESCTSHCQFLPLDSLQSLGCPSGDGSWKALEIQLLLCLAAHPGAWRTRGQTQE